MTEESAAAQPEVQSGSQSGFTPRKVKPDAGSINQTQLRDDIAKAMRDEMLTCRVDAFLEKLAPFSPDAQWIENAYNHLKDKRLLGTPAETSIPAKTTQRKTRTSARVRERAATRVEDAVPQVDAQSVNIVEWEAYRNTTPGQSGVNEMKAFEPLKDIVQALNACPAPSTSPHHARKSIGYCYKDCPSQTMKSEILGANFRVDAVIANTEIYKEKGKVIPLAAAQTAVVMEFKKEAAPEKVYENRKQLVGAANHIMNDDPRRNWMYGVTIEDTDMSLWYFSRSYSMKSAPFNFTKDLKTFIRVFLSFLYATDQELGHDPSIHRELYNKEWCYIYELKTEKGPKYYRTVEQLYSPRSYCITGRKSRVWKVVEIAGLKKLRTSPSKRAVVLKDCWVDEGFLSEKEIQTRIFERLRDIREADYAWATSGLNEKLKDGLAHPETYFMKVELDWKEEPGMGKEKPKYELAPDLLARPDTSSNASSGKVIPSSQKSARIAYSSSSAFNSSQRRSNIGRGASKKREYKLKRHYRVVYADVGESLAYTKHLCDAVKAFQDVFIALTLLFLAGWVHRDVSVGNIILVRNGDSVQGKLSDLEYARDFNEENRAVSTDPKTGTPYFMPIEIHSEQFLFPKLSLTDSNVSLFLNRNDIVSNSGAASPALKYIFIHDLESLWWIMIWTFLLRVTGSKLLDIVIFTADSTPHKDRRQFFTMGDSLLSYLKSFMHDLLCELKVHEYLVVYNQKILGFYAAGNREEATSYYPIYDILWRATTIFTERLEGIDLELGDQSKRSHPTSAGDSQELGKRTRSIDGGSPAHRRGSMEGSSKTKKQKAGEHNAEKGTTQDMTRVACEDADLRIRGTWN